MSDSPTPECALPFSNEHYITLGHGSGGQLANRLLETVVYPAFDNAILSQAHDSALLTIAGQQLAFTTDSFVVNPLFFPGGDIGKLAVCGTVNDLAMGGARPLYLSCGLILEEGLPITTLKQVLASMASTAAQLGIKLVTGDTKVVEKNKGDGLYINTAGIGIVEHATSIAPKSIRNGDLIILSGDIGRHGMAIMALREGLQFDNPLHSDCGLLWEPVEALFSAGLDVHCLRDLTRGGLATALVELAEVSGMSMLVEETAIPVNAAVSGACEMLGIEPCYVANEGRFIAFVPAEQADAALAALHQSPIADTSCVIGRVTGDSQKGEVVFRTTLGNERLLERLPGELLPRIC